MDNELDLCPFCDGEPEKIIHGDPNKDKIWSSSIRCVDCGASTDAYDYDDSEIMWQKRVPSKIKLPEQPTDGLLMSMAMRYDHGLGVDGYYDTIFGDGEHTKRLEFTLKTMRQLYEEVSGHGFYQPDKERYYANLLPKCKHEWVDCTNDVIVGTEFCFLCSKGRAMSTDRTSCKHNFEPTVYEYKIPSEVCTKCRTVHAKEVTNND